MGSHIRHIRPFYSIYIYNISMYRFFSGIAGRKDERVNLSLLSKTRRARRPSSFVSPGRASRVFARKSDHRAPLNLQRCKTATFVLRVREEEARYHVSLRFVSAYNLVSKKDKTEGRS